MPCPSVRLSACLTWQQLETFRKRNKIERKSLFVYNSWSFYLLMKEFCKNKNENVIIVQSFARQFSTGFSLRFLLLFFVVNVKVHKSQQNKRANRNYTKLCLFIPKLQKRKLFSKKCSVQTIVSRCEGLHVGRYLLSCIIYE